MTLIMTCITQDLVVQVSDRRLVDLSTGQPCKNNQNKVVDFSGHMAFAYTGLANLSSRGTKPTDLWLAEAMCDSR